MKQHEDVVRPDYEKFAGLELRAPPGWAQLLSRFRGGDLAMVIIGAITIAAIVRGEDLLSTLPSIGAVLALGLVGVWINRKADAPSSKNTIEGQAQPRHARGNAATT